MTDHHRIQARDSGRGRRRARGDLRALADVVELDEHRLSEVRGGGSPTPAWTLSTAGLLDEDGGFGGDGGYGSGGGGASGSW